MTNAPRTTRDEDAWRWVIRMDTDDWTAAQEAELQAWLDADPLRPGALLEAEGMWLALGNLEGDNLATVEHVSERASPRSRWLSRRGLIASGGAALAASFVGALFLTGGETRYETAIGEIRRVPLADGSTAAINTASRVEVRLAEDRREVLLSEGEVWIQVAPDRTRPFIVEAGRVRVRAVGTAFSVRRREDGADILVTEGIVEAWADGAEGNMVRLAAGERAFVGDNAGIVRPDATITSVDRTLAWRSGRVDFVDEPIADAVAEFNRYNRRQLVLVDRAVGREHFDGVFRTDDPEGFASAIRTSLGVPVDLSDPNEIRIGRK